MQAGRRLHTSRAVRWVNTGAQAAAVRRWLLVLALAAAGCSAAPEHATAQDVSAIEHQRARWNAAVAQHDLSALSVRPSCVPLPWAA